ncbi:MAG: hypothetical protein ABI433_01000 [Burkholderiaceae bacterium]
MTTAKTDYAIKTDLLQAIVSSLSSQPAGAVRGLLNAIESECVRQDQEHAEQATAAQREAIKAELKAEVQAPALPTIEAP